MTEYLTKILVSVWARFRELGLDPEKMTPLFLKFGYDPQSRNFREELISLSAKLSSDAGEKRSESIKVRLEEEYEVSVQ